MAGTGRLGKTESLKTLKPGDENRTDGTKVVKVWHCVIPAGAEILTVDFHYVTLGSPMFVDIPDDLLKPID